MEGGPGLAESRSSALPSGEGRGGSTGWASSRRVLGSSPPFKEPSAPNRGAEPRRVSLLVSRKEKSTSFLNGTQRRLKGSHYARPELDQSKPHRPWVLLCCCWGWQPGLRGAEALVLYEVTSHSVGLK